MTYSGSIEDVLGSGEYDQGDTCLVKYDELADLVEQARFFVGVLKGQSLVGKPEEREDWDNALWRMERRTNRPLHPCLGGKSPYSEFLPL